MAFYPQEMQDKFKQLWRAYRKRALHIPCALALSIAMFNGPGFIAIAQYNESQHKTAASVIQTLPHGVPLQSGMLTTASAKTAKERKKAFKKAENERAKELAQFKQKPAQTIKLAKVEPLEPEAAPMLMAISELPSKKQHKAPVKETHPQTDAQAIPEPQKPGKKTERKSKPSGKPETPAHPDWQKSDFKEAHVIQRNMRKQLEKNHKAYLELLKQSGQQGQKIAAAPKKPATDEPLAMLSLAGEEQPTKKQNQATKTNKADKQKSAKTTAKKPGNKPVDLASELTPIEEIQARTPQTPVSQAVQTSPKQAVPANDHLLQALQNIINDTPNQNAAKTESDTKAVVKTDNNNTLEPLRPKQQLASKTKKTTAKKATGEQYNLLSSAIIDKLDEPQSGSYGSKYGGGGNRYSRKAPPSKLPPLQKAYSDMPSIESGNADVNVLKSGVSSTLNEIDVTINKAVILNLSKPAARVSISNPEIASVMIISPTQIQLIGNQVGVANLLVWGDANAPEHTIIDVQVHRDVSVLARQLKYVDSGIQIVPLAAEDSVILTGEASSRESAQIAIDLAKAFFKGGGSGVPGGGSGGMSGGKSSISSASPGSAMSHPSPNIINLINVKGEPSTKLELARRKLKEIDPNIELDIVPGVDGSEKAILTGRVKTSNMISKAINTASVFYGQPGIKLLAGPGGNTIRNTAGSNDFPEGNKFSDNLDVNVLQGSIMTDTSGQVVSMLEVSLKPQIKCSIQFIEINKNNLDALGNAIFGIGNGFAFSSLSGAQTGPTGRPVAGLDQDQSGATWLTTKNQKTGAKTNSMAGGFSQVLSNGVTQAFQINENFVAAISALEEKKKARSLAEPTLTLLSGEKASFLAGGEVPIPVIGGNGQVNVTYHEFGIRLNLVATYLDNGKIHMLVAPEISSVDPANGVTTASVSVPGFRTRRMQSTLQLDHGQSFVLAGLYNQDEVWSTSQFPWAGSIPILGSLLRNKWKTSARTELIVIIKPEVVMLEGDTNEPVGYPLPPNAYTKTAPMRANPAVSSVLKSVPLQDMGTTSSQP